MLLYIPWCSTYQVLPRDDTLAHFLAGFHHQFMHEALVAIEKKKKLSKISSSVIACVSSLTIHYQEEFFAMEVGIDSVH